jgi:hypothetical protein
MKMDHKQALSQLRDINGLDIDVSTIADSGNLWFVMILVLTGILIWRYFAAMPRWKIEARNHLSALEEQINSGTEPASLLPKLSEIFRRIAMKTKGRNQCAGLYGEQWLIWLQENDPEGFAWLEKGKCMADLSFAPDQGDIRSAEVKQLINAVKGWVQPHQGLASSVFSLQNNTMK